jgi:hypothetical protein
MKTEILLLLLFDCNKPNQVAFIASTKSQLIENMTANLAKSINW